MHSDADISSDDENQNRNFLNSSFGGSQIQDETMSIDITFKVFFKYVFSKL